MSTPSEKSNRIKRALLTATLLGALLQNATHAAEKTWTSGGSNSWSAGANWAGGLPGASDLAIFNNSSSIWAGPGTNNAPSVGGIFLQGTRTTTQLIQPFNSSSNTSLRLNGASYDLNGTTVNLLLGNTSNATLSVANRLVTSGTTSTLYSMPVTLGASGVVYAESTIILGSDVGDAGAGHSITKKGSGLLQLGDGNGGANTFSGGFIIEEGVVTTFAGSSVSGGSIASSPFGTGTLTLRGGQLRTLSATSRSYSNAVNLDGIITLGQTAAEGSATGNITFSANAGKSTTLLRNSELIVKNRTDWAQGISGNYGLTKSGIGTLLLTNNSNTYSGDTVVSQGALYVNGSLAVSNVEVLSGARFGGTGTVNGDIIVRSGATFAAGYYDAYGTSIGNTRGTFKSYGDLTLEAGAELAFRLDSTAYDRIYTEGTVSLDGASLNLTLSYQPLVDDVFVLIQNEGFDSIGGLLKYNGMTLTDGSLFQVTSGDFSQYFTIHYGYSEDGYYNSLAITASAIPEPGTMTLLAVASGAAVLIARRKNRAD